MHIDPSQIQTLVQESKHVVIDKTLANKLIHLLDLTDLSEQADEQSIQYLCQQARETIHVAAVCIWPRFIKLAKNYLANTDINIATVVNFPHGNKKQVDVLSEIKECIDAGADEIDVVFPYQRYLQGQSALEFVHACKDSCGSTTLKMILETGAFPDVQSIARASYEAISAGAHFIKTSTGKIAQGASLEAAATMLLVIQHIQKAGFDAGIKLSGGIRTAQEAAHYWQLTANILTEDWINTRHMRFGASRLLQDLRKM